MSVFKHNIWNQILDGTKKSWHVSDRTAEAFDLFEVEVVEPLRELAAEHKIDIEEVEAPVESGGRRVKAVIVKRVLPEDQ